MDMAMKAGFVESWNRYFKGAELPISFYYTNAEDAAELVPAPSAHMCMIGVLARVRKGASLSFDVDSIGCGGGKRYSGFTRDISPLFEYFLSCGLPGKMEGERYKKSPAIVKQWMDILPKFKAPSRFVVFKRWDKIDEEDKPDVVIFFGTPDVISGLFTLANFDNAEPNGVFAPFSAGCGTIVLYPYLEAKAKRPRGVLGMFDVSARPCVPSNVFTFAVPMKRFVAMVGYMEESFFTTESWEQVRKRIARETKVKS
jgi:uncharacterized protein (DUF169 family)